MRPRAEAGDGDERVVERPVGHQRDLGHVARPQVAVERVGGAADRRPRLAGEHRPGGRQLDGGTDLEVLEGDGLAAGAQQHPRAALAGEVGAGAVDGIDEVPPRPSPGDGHGIVIPLHHDLAGPAAAPAVELREHHRVGALVDAEDVVKPPIDRNRTRRAADLVDARCLAGQRNGGQQPDKPAHIRRSSAPRTARGSCA